MEIIELKTDFELGQVIKIHNESLIDFKKIKDLKYVDEIKKNGFFIAPYSLKELKEDKDKILLGIRKNSKILAFIWVSIFIEKHKYNHWVNKDIKNKVLNKRIYKLKGIGVLKSKARQGLASKLLNEMENYLNDKTIEYLVSSVAFNPIKNLVSIKFHKKNSFKKISISPKVKHFDFDDYQCILMAKKIN